MAGENPWKEAEIISAYSRAQAIEDGALVDLMQPGTVALVKEAGFRFPIAMTRAAWHECVIPVSGKLPERQDLNGRLWDVLWLLKCAIRRANGSTNRVNFEVRVWTGKRHKVVRLWSLCGPGDDAEPVITILLEGED